MLQRGFHHKLFYNIHLSLSRYPRVSTSKCNTSIIMARYQHDVSTHNSLAEVKGQARKIFDAGVESVMPDRMVKGCLHLNGNTLTVKGSSHYIIDHNVYVVGFGKAVIGMVKAVDEVLGDHIVGGIASVPMGIQADLQSAGRQNLLPNKSSKVKLMEGAKNNLPDNASHQAANQIAALASNLTDKDILIVLVSGGGSALLPSPVPPISLEDKYKATKALSTKGATIDELNTVRKNLSTLKGGGLAKLAYPAKVVTLMLSDIIGDPIDLIASGPTVADTSMLKDCLDIIKRLEIKDEIPSSIMKYLTERAAEDEGQRSNLDHVMNVIVGSNTIAVKNAVEKAEMSGYVSLAHSTRVDGEARVIGKMYSTLASYMYECYCVGLDSQDKGQGSADIGLGSKSAQMQYQQLLSLLLRTEYGIKESTLVLIQEAAETAAIKRQPMCVIGAGETTVTVSGDGKGGRNQEMALSAAISMTHSPIFQHLQQQGFQLVLMSSGTDGQDGPTDATGAFAYPGQVTDASQSAAGGLNANDFLENNDSYSFYKQLDDGNDLVVTGLTGTNVMDLQILLLHPPK